MAWPNLLDYRFHSLNWWDYHWEICQYENGRNYYRIRYCLSCWIFLLMWANNTHHHASIEFIMFLTIRVTWYWHIENVWEVFHLFFGRSYHRFYRCSCAGLFTLVQYVFDNILCNISKLFYLLIIMYLYIINNNHGIGKQCKIVLSLSLIKQMNGHNFNDSISSLISLRQLRFCFVIINRLWVERNSPFWCFVAVIILSF